MSTLLLELECVHRRGEDREHPSDSVPRSVRWGRDSGRQWPSLGDVLEEEGVRHGKVSCRCSVLLSHRATALGPAELTL